MPALDRAGRSWEAARMSSRHRSIVVVQGVALVVAALASARAGSAQKPTSTAPPASSSSAAAAPPVPPAGPMPDIVRLKDGSFVRGTILEHGAQTRTVIETRTGVRTFEAAEVVYAGLATRDPGGSPGEAAAVPAPTGSASAAAAPSAPGIDKQVHFRADTARVQYHAIALGKGAASAATLTPLCVAPCDLTLERGAYRLALGWEGQAPLFTRENIELKEGATVQGRVLSRKATRVAGWSIVGLSTVPIVYGLIRGFTSKGSDSGVGFVVAVVGAGTMGAGLVITRAKDVAEAELVEEKKDKSALGPATPSSRPLVVGMGGQF